MRRGLRACILLLVGLIALVPPAKGREMDGDGAHDDAASVDLRKEALAHLRFLHGMSFAIRGCMEAARAVPQMRPALGGEVAEQALRAAETRARQAGLPVDDALREATPVGLATARAIQAPTPENLRQCRQSGKLFRLILERLDAVMRELAGSDAPMEKAR